jgi:hypothetical protein
LSSWIDHPDHPSSRPALCPHRSIPQQQRRPAAAPASSSTRQAPEPGTPAKPQNLQHLARSSTSSRCLKPRSSPRFPLDQARTSSRIERVLQTSFAKQTSSRCLKPRFPLDRARPAGKLCKARVQPASSANRIQPTSFAKHTSSRQAPLDRSCHLQALPIASSRQG